MFPTPAFVRKAVAIIYGENAPQKIISSYSHEDQRVEIDHAYLSGRVNYRPHEANSCGPPVEMYCHLNQ